MNVHMKSMHTFCTSFIHNNLVLKILTLSFNSHSTSIVQREGGWEGGREDKRKEGQAVILSFLLFKTKQNCLVFT